MISIIPFAMLLALSVCSTAQTGETKAGTGVVRKVKGSASYSRGADEWRVLKPGDELSAGTIVQTGLGSKVDIVLGVNGTTLRLTGDTLVVLEKLTHSGAGRHVIIDTRLELLSGRILGIVSRLASSSSYEIKTPTGLARTYGGTYDITSRTNLSGKFKTSYFSQTDVLDVTELVDGVEKTWNANSIRPRNWTMGDPAPPGTDWFTPPLPRPPPPQFWGLQPNPIVLIIPAHH